VRRAARSWAPIRRSLYLRALLREPGLSDENCILSGLLSIAQGPNPVNADSLHSEPNTDSRLAMLAKRLPEFSRSEDADKWVSIFSDHDTHTAFFYSQSSRP
jgi:hypothetical protein